MKLGTFFATAAVAAGLGAGATAQQLLASDPQSFVDFFAAEGYRPELREDSVGDPLVVFRYEGERMFLLFYDCIDHADCAAVQYYAGYPMDGTVPLEVINDWNTGLTRRFTRAGAVEDGTVRFEMDIATSLDGVSARDFNHLLKLWLTRKQEFEDLIGY